MADNGTGQTVSADQLIQIVGIKEVQIQLLQAQLQAALKQLADLTASQKPLDGIIKDPRLDGLIELVKKS